MATALQPTPAEIASSLLDFTDAEFAAAPDLDVDAREVRLLETDFTGIAISAQARVAVDAQSVLPVAIAARYDGERDWDLPLIDNSLLVATDLRSGRVSVVPALLPPKVLASRLGPPPDAAAAQRPEPEELEGEGAQLGWTEVRERMNIPWRSGLWSFTLVYFDWLSNRVSVELAGGSSVPAGFPARLSASPQPAALADGLPTFRQRAGTPPVPAHGVNFQVRLQTQGPSPALLVDASFATPVRAYSLATGLVLSDAGQASPVSAIVPMTLLLVRANAVYPWRLDVAVPAYGPPAQPGETVTGQFALDALAGAPVPGPGAYACYVVLDGQVHGPQRFEMSA